MRGTCTGDVWGQVCGPEAGSSPLPLLSPSVPSPCPQLPLPNQGEDSSVLFQASVREDARRLRQKEEEEEFQLAVVKTQSYLRETEGPYMKEKIQGQIRQWFIECQSVSPASAPVPLHPCPHPCLVLWSNLGSFLHSLTCYQHATDTWA